MTLIRRSWEMDILKRKPYGWTRAVLVLALGVQVNAPPARAQVALDEVVVTGENEVQTHLRKRRETHSGAVNVVGEDELRRLNTPNIGDVLSRVPGITYTDEDGRGLRPDIGLRGLPPRRSEQVLILRDGIPVQPSAYSEPSAYYGVAAERVAGLEVVKGGAGILYGPNTVGGVINYLSRPLSLRPLAVEVDLRGENRSGAFGNVAMSGTRGRYGYGLEVLRKQGSGFRENNGYKINDVEGKFQYDLGGGAKLRTHAQYYDERSGTPGSLTPQQFESDITQTAKPNDLFLGERIEGDVTFEQLFGENHKLTLPVYAYYFRRDWYIQDFAAGSGLALKNTSTQNLREFNVIGFDPKYVWTYGGSHQLELGGRVYHDALDRRSATGPVFARRGEGVETEKLDYTTLALAFYAQNQFSITDRWSLIPGLRYETVRMERKNNLNDTSGGMDVNAFLPGLGTTYRLAQGVRLFANVSQTFRPPTFQDSFEPGTSASRDLKPSRATTYEAGVRSDPFPWLSVDAAAFRFDYKDRIVVSGGKAANFDTQSQGVEGTLNVGLVSLARRVGTGEAGAAPFDLFLSAGGTLQETEFINGVNDGKDLPYAPRQTYTWGLRGEWKDRMNAQIQGRYVGEQYADDANTRVVNAAGTNGLIPAYRVWDLNLQMHVAKHVSISGGVRNLFDQKYITERNTFFRGVTPGPNRSFYVGTNLKF